MSTDQGTFRLVVMFLGATLLLSLVGIVTIVALDKEVPDILGQMAVGALAGLAGLLARTPTNDRPQQVTVVNAEADPVPVVPS